MWFELGVKGGIRSGRPFVSRCRALRLNGASFRLDSLFGRTLFVCAFFVGQLLFPSVQIGLALGQLFFFLRLMFGIELTLHLTLNFGLALCFGLLFLTRTKNRDRHDQRQNNKLLHVQA